MLLFLTLLFATFAVRALPQLSPSIQYENVTFYATDPRFQYAPSCGSTTSVDWPNCPGGWSRYYDRRFSNGVAMIAANPSADGDIPYPHMTFTFKGKFFFT